MLNWLYNIFDGPMTHFVQTQKDLSPVRTRSVQSVSCRVDMTLSFVSVRLMSQHQSKNGG